MEYLEVIRQPNFIKLWLAQIFSQVGQNLLYFALIILVFDFTKTSQFANFSVALLVLAFGLPALLFASTAGTLVDHWDRRTILFVSNLLRTALAISYIWIEHNLALILLVSFVGSTIMQFFVPAETATIPRLVSSKALMAANSLFIFTLYAAFIVGYSASGPAVQLFGHHGPYAVVAVFFAIAAVLSGLLPKQPVNKAQDAPQLRPHLIRDAQENWKLVHKQADRFFSVLQLTVSQAVVAVLVTLAPALSLALLHIPLQQASHVLIIPVGVGMVMGILVANVVTRAASKTLVIQVGLIIAAITLTMVGLSGQLWRVDDGSQILPEASIALIVGMLMFILGVINAMISATAQTLLQESTSDANRGKVFASLNMMINIAATAPILIVGLLADLFSVTKVITALGALLTIYAFYMIWHYRPEVPARLLK